MCVSGSWLVREISVFNILRHGSYFIKLLTSGPHPLARSDSVTAKQWSNSAKNSICWRPANAPILPGSAQTFHIDWRLPLQGWPTTVHQSVGYWNLQSGPADSGYARRQIVTSDGCSNPSVALTPVASMNTTWTP